MAAAALALLGLGLVMVGSSSIGIADRDFGMPLYYAVRQGVFVLVGLALALLVLRIPLTVWERAGPFLLLSGYVLLGLVLLIGREVNGSTRWISLGPVNLQVSELFKLFMIIYLAGYIRRHEEAVQGSVAGFLKPLALLGAACLLLLLEPDFGAAAVLAVTVLGVLFLAGVRWWLFGVLVLLVAGLAALLAVSAPYRMARMTTFLNPWADPYNSGFQLTQALIAFGRGEWLGVGLGGSVQKLFYLPEAHTDFLFAVLAEELGLVGVVVVIALFTLLVWRALLVGRSAWLAERPFAAYLAYGLGLGIALQVFINIGVNMGILPTKGLTLPLMSYGGSSIVATCIAVALLLRVAYENRFDENGKPRAGEPW
ncbi:MAG TPA: putative lipid II flippase FtsW [Gammaproteobacteria bacterium]|nr:putative lipid II flippase FtsW [Gammaproteobacteria bacterium]